MPQLSILVVDDDQEIREFLKDFLEGEGYAVSLLGDPTAASDALKENQYHLIILDLMMPELSGIDLLGQIRQADNDVAIIILTGHPSLETATTSITLDVSAYIRKPFTPQEFRDAIERIAKKKGLHISAEEELHSSIGRTIRELRKERTLTLRQLSRRTDLSVSLLSQIERAESSASVSSLFKVATALNVNISALFGDY